MLMIKSLCNLTVFTYNNTPKPYPCEGASPLVGDIVYLNIEIKIWFIIIVHVVQYEVLH